MEAIHFFTYCQVKHVIRESWTHDHILHHVLIGRVAIWDRIHWWDKPLIWHIFNVTENVVFSRGKEKARFSFTIMNRKEKSELRWNKKDWNVACPVCLGIYTSSEKEEIYKFTIMPLIFHLWFDWMKVQPSFPLKCSSHIQAECI